MLYMMIAVSVAILVITVVSIALLVSIPSDSWELMKLVNAVFTLSSRYKLSGTLSISGKKRGSLDINSIADGTDEKLRNKDKPEACKAMV